MTTLKQIVSAVNNIKRYEKAHGSNDKTTKAIACLWRAYSLVKSNGGK